MSQMSNPPHTAPDVRVMTNDFIPGAIGTIAALHGTYYAAQWGFGAYFEAKVARELADFAMCRTNDDLVLLAVDAHGVAASLILDLHDPASGDRGGRTCAGSSSMITFAARERGDGSWTRPWHMSTALRAVEAG